jgi:hypothetical protein
MQSNSPYLTKKEAAEWLRMSERWLEEQLTTDYPPPIMKVGKRYVFKSPELEFWFESKFRTGEVGEVIQDSFVE